MRQGTEHQCTAQGWPKLSPLHMASQDWAPAVERHLPDDIAMQIHGRPGPIPRRGSSFFGGKGKWKEPQNGVQLAPRTLALEKQNIRTGCALWAPLRAPQCLSV